jgi:diguanylate cyclase (GGDEF)-like protein/PAS domain S-box-containing protein
MVVVHFLAEISLSLSPRGALALNVISTNALAMAAICFIVSTMVLAEGRRVALRLLLGLTLGTVLCLTLAEMGASAWLLAAAILARQALAVLLALRKRRRPRAVGAALGTFFLFTGTCMVACVLYGHSQLVPAVLLGELFLAPAFGFWANGWNRTFALRLMIGGLVAWGLVFPAGYLLAQSWPASAIDRELWNLPKFFVAVGMILVVFEEDARASQLLNADYRLLFESNPVALWILDRNTLAFLAANQTTLKMLGYAREKFLRMRLPDILHPDAKDEVLSQVATRQALHHSATHHIRKDGSMVALDLHAYGITFRGRECQLFMAVDVSRQDALERQIDEHMRCDHLTGLPNRACFPDLLTRTVEQAAAAGEKVAILSLDFDGFKHVNEMYGLRVGDGYIQKIAGVLSSRMRATDVIARTAGDEFTIVLTGLKGVEAAEQMAHELVSVFRNPLLVQGYKVQRPISIGGAVASGNGTDANTLWGGAETARLQAKRQGGDRVVWVSQELFRSADERRLLEECLRGNPCESGFHLHYQPLYGIDGTIHGLEALLRLDHPVLGAISPIRLIPIAEETGLILSLGQWVLEEVCRQLLKWKSEGVTPVPVAVNVSALQLMHEDFAHDLTATLERYAIEPRLIHVEVTESVAMQNVAAISERMAALTALGIHFSIDDFGTGHSSLARLSQLETSELKIDRSFVEPACTQTSHSIVQAIVTMAHALGHVVVVEGVETEAQLRCLRELHCDLYQGFLLSRPVPASAVPALLETPHPLLAPNCGPLWHEIPRPQLVG